MSLHIAPVTADDAASVTAWVRVMNQVNDHETPHFPRRTERAGQLMQRHRLPARIVRDHLAWLDGEPVARLETSAMTEQNQRSLAFTIEVVPAFRRRGIGRALFERMLEYAREHGHTKLITGTSLSLPDLPAPDEAGPAFATALGFSNTLPEVQRRLDVAGVDENVLAGMLSAARAKAAGYRVVRWRDAAPAEHVERVAYLDSRLMADAPMGDLSLEPEKPDVARHRRIEQVLAARERRTFHTGAVHEDSGELVAWTFISAGDEAPWHAFQQITIVDPKHRGHRLGALVKVENLRFFCEAEPQVAHIDTFNAAENSYMISINEQMGFRPVAAFQNWQRDLEPSAEPAA
ncbi:GNAT family N-acetyltransferase [Catellatospora sp. NPDC049609]|uniref:GNAT family N-acetyltransferase n=1 Tax=Catellatospora sp. NPDC049609 TaxID=3155505 RepID=UPI00344619DE